MSPKNRALYGKFVLQLSRVREAQGGPFLLEWTQDHLQSPVRLKSFLVWGIRTIIPTQTMLLIRTHLFKGAVGCWTPTCVIFFKTLLVRIYLSDSLQICYGAWSRWVLLKFCSTSGSTSSKGSFAIYSQIWHFLQKSYCQKLRGRKRWNYYMVFCTIYST